MMAAGTAGTVAGSVSRLERRYRKLLIAYPREYRSAHGGVLVGTLLEASASGQRIPSLREAVALVVGGLVERARAAVVGSPPWWADGFHLAALAMTVANVVMSLTVPSLRPIWVAVVALQVLFILRGWVRLALPLAVAAAAQFTVLLLPLSDAQYEFAMRYAHFGLGYGSWLVAASYWLVAGLLAALSLRSSGGALWRVVRGGADLATRSWWWLLMLIIAEIAQINDAAFTSDSVWKFRAVLEAGLLVSAIWAAIAARDGRWVLAAGLYFAPVITGSLDSPVPWGRFPLAYWSAMRVLTVVAIAAAVVWAFQARRRAPQR
jgi:hypothetical protein